HQKAMEEISEADYELELEKCEKASGDARKHCVDGVKALPLFFVFSFNSINAVFTRITAGFFTFLQLQLVVRLTDFFHRLLMSIPHLLISLCHTHALLMFELGTLETNIFVVAAIGFAFYLGEFQFRISVTDQGFGSGFGGILFSSFCIRFLPLTLCSCFSNTDILCVIF